MRIENGTQGQLVIAGVFAGTCGLNAGKVAFSPAPGEKKLEPVCRATLNGKPVVLSDIRPAGDGRSYTAQVHG